MDSHVMVKQRILEWSGDAEDRQNRAEQSRTKQNRAEQSRTKQKIFLYVSQLDTTRLFYRRMLRAIYI